MRTAVTTLARIVRCVAIGAVALLDLPASASGGDEGGWRLVLEGQTGGISGLAYEGSGACGDRYLAVHDGKGPGQPRLSRIVVSGLEVVGAIAVPWRGGAGSPPLFDGEAISAVPGEPGGFLVVGKRRKAAAAGGGRPADPPAHLLYHLHVDDTAATVRGFAEIPGLAAESDVEAFSARSLSGRSVAAWARRGGEEGTPGATNPALLAWGTLAISADGAPSLTTDGTAEIRVPVPAAGPSSRPVSDLKIDGRGTLWGTAASDGGDDGPFLGALYRLGSFRVGDDGRVRFEADPAPTPRGTWAHKVEALEIVPATGRLLLGADDENRGGWLRVPGGPLPTSPR